MSSEVAPPVILITGCSTGIGYACAHGLKARGWRVFATARKPEDCARLRGEGLESFPLDYDDEASIAAALEKAIDLSGGRLDALFNNGGFAQAGAVEDLSTDLVRAQFETNFFGWHELTRRVIPVMRRQGHGRIVFCSSVFGFVTARFRGAYAASKHAVEGYADSLRVELRGTGIRVSLIEPGPIESRFRLNAMEKVEGLDRQSSVHAAAYDLDLAGRVGGEKDTRFRLGPEAVLDALVHAVESPRPRPRYRITIPTRVVWHLKRLLPARLLDRLLVRGG